MIRLTRAVMLNMAVFLESGILAVATLTPEPLLAGALVCVIADIAAGLLVKFHPKW